MRDAIETSPYNRHWKVTLLAILALQGFGLSVGSLLWYAIVDNMPANLRTEALKYATFAGGNPNPFPLGSTNPIVIDGFYSYYWTLIGAVIGGAFAWLSWNSKRVAQDNKGDRPKLS